MAKVSISVKCLAFFVFSLFPLSDGRDSDADCDQFFDQFCCNKKCVDKSSSDCCTKDSDCFAIDSCCQNFKCKLDCDDGDNGNTMYIALGAGAFMFLLILLASCSACCYQKRRRLRYVVLIEEDAEIIVPNNSNNVGCARPPSYQQGYPSAPFPHIPSTTACRHSYGAVQAAAHR